MRHRVPGGVDGTLPLVIAPNKFCPRKLGQLEDAPTAKRYLGVGRPLLGYMIACPGCFFVEMHMHEKAKYVEDATGALTATMGTIKCLSCARVITVHDGVIEAKLG